MSASYLSTKEGAGCLPLSFRDPTLRIHGMGSFRQPRRPLKCASLAKCTQPNFIPQTSHATHQYLYVVNGPVNEASSPTEDLCFVQMCRGVARGGACGCS